MDIHPPDRSQRSALYAKWGAALFLLASLSLVLLDLAVSYRQQEQEARRQASGLSQLLAERLASGMHEAGLILQGSNQIPQVQQLLHDGSLSPEKQQSLYQALQQRQQLAPYLQRIEIVDTACQTIFSSRRVALLRLRHSEFCRWLHRGELQDENYTTAQYSALAGGIMLADKLHNSKGELVGMATGLINSNFFQDEVSRLTVGERGEIMVLDLNGQVVSRWPSRPRGQSFQALQPRQVFNRESNQLLFSAPSSVDGMERLYSMRATGNYPFQVAVGIAHDDIALNVKDKAMLALPCWLFVAALTLLALRKHLAHLQQNQLLMHSNTRIKESEEQARLILDTVPMALMLVNPRTARIQRANSQARSLLRLPSSEEDRSVINLPLQLEPVRQWLSEGLDMREREAELELEDKSRLWTIVSLQTVQLSHEPSVLVALYDISMRKQLEQQLQDSNRQLEEMAITDPLTHLYNRRHADLVLRDEISRCERYSQAMAIAVFDIDHFKQFNDHYGHQTGDNVLVAVANALRDSTRSTDLCARIGGEEFLVIFPFTRLSDAQKVMQRMQKALEHATVPLFGQTITFSGGLTDWRPGDTPAQMQSRADKLLYQAKLAGRNLILIDQDSP
ncbi:hypothetical protein CEK28_17475 [Xenophilus sp. AP218F]|nr:hypothetical protein CEK28_17475 [Xenophilus sp. AP218F]